MADTTKMTAAELRALAASKDWGEYCQARIARQKARLESIEKKIARYKAAKAEAELMLAAAEKDLKNGPPADWKRRGTGQGVNIAVPAANLTARGN